jgi:sugar phosphate isomerase/epimerase
MALVSAPLAAAFGAKINSKIDGVRLGAITYTFRSIERPDPMAIIKAYVDVGLGECELTSDHCELLAGAPVPPPAGGAGMVVRTAGGVPMVGAPEYTPGQAPNAPGGGQGRGAGGGGRTAATPEQQAARAEAQAKLAAWRKATTPATWKGVAKKFNDAGVTVALLGYNMNDRMTDEDIEYGFGMAEGFGVKYMTTSTTLTMAKRIAPVADRHKLIVGYHGHDRTDDPNQTARMESYETLLAYGKYAWINLDIGHFTAANYDAVDFITKHHDKITNLHIKDRKKNHGPNMFPWGTGDTPIKAVLQLMKKNKYPFPADMELESFPPGTDVVELAKQCFAYMKNCLA